jgi:archaellum component FlaF (FlaF/FlaG flagellin family)
MRIALRKSTILSMVALLLLGSFAVFSGKVAANPSTLLFIDPPEIIDPSLVPCVSDFAINVSIKDVVNMKTCQFNLTYDSSLIGLIRIGFQRVNGQFPMTSLDIDDSAGYIWMKLAYASAVTVSAPAALVTITFHLKNRGSTPLNLTDTKITDPDGNLIPHDVQNGFFAAQIRDVAVTNVAVSRTWAYQGWPVNVTVTVKNNGNVTETFDLHTYYASSLIGTITVTGLTPNEERNVLFMWDTTGVAEGNYTIKAQADPVPFEFNLGDNTLVDGAVSILNSSPGHVHDVAVYDVVLARSWVYYGWVVTINVTAWNVGGFNETFDINAYYNGTFLIGTAHVGNLGPSEMFTAQFSLNTSSLLPCHTYPISGETTAIPYEYNTANNVLVDGGLKVRFIGDVNGDGKVDVKDVYAVSQAFGSYGPDYLYPGSPPHPKWNSDADINGDNKIDVKDIYAVSKNYGTSCP